jgi:hypothetical protein
MLLVSLELLLLRREWLVEGSGMGRGRIAVCAERCATPRAMQGRQGLGGLIQTSATRATHLRHALASS